MLITQERDYKTMLRSIVQNFRTQAKPEGSEGVVWRVTCGDLNVPGFRIEDVYCHVKPEVKPRALNP